MLILSLLAGGALCAAATAEPSESWRDIYDKDFNERWDKPNLYTIFTVRREAEDDTPNAFLDTYNQLSGKNIANVAPLKHGQILIDAEDVDNMYRELSIVVPKVHFFKTLIQFALRVRAIHSMGDRAKLYLQIAKTVKQIEEAGVIIDINAFTLGFPEDDVWKFTFVPRLGSMCANTDVECVEKSASEFQASVQYWNKEDGKKVLTNSISLGVLLLTAEYAFYESNAQYLIYHSTNIGDLAFGHGKSLLTNKWQETAYFALFGSNEVQTPHAKRDDSPKKLSLQLGSAGANKEENIVDTRQYFTHIIRRLGEKESKGALLAALYKWMTESSAEPRESLNVLINELESLTNSKEVEIPKEIGLITDPLIEENTAALFQPRSRSRSPRRHSRSPSPSKGLPEGAMCGKPRQHSNSRSPSNKAHKHSRSRSKSPRHRHGRKGSKSRSQRNSRSPTPNKKSRSPSRERMEE